MQPGCCDFCLHFAGSVSSFISNVCIMVCWSVFMEVALISLSDNSPISLILSLASVDCLFSFVLRFTWNDKWFLKPGRFGYYVRRFWILIRSLLVRLCQWVSFFFSWRWASLWPEAKFVVVDFKWLHPTCLIPVSLLSLSNSSFYPCLHLCVHSSSLNC